MKIELEIQSLQSVLKHRNGNFQDWYETMKARCGIEMTTFGKPVDQATIRLSYLARTFLYTRAVLIEFSKIFKSTPKEGRITNPLVTQKLLHNCSIFSESVAAFSRSDYVVKEGVLAPSKPLLTVLRRCLIVEFGAFDLIEDCILAKEHWWDKGQSGMTTRTYDEIIPRQFDELRKGERITSIEKKFQRRKEHLQYLAEYVRMLIEMSEMLDNHEKLALSNLAYTSKQEMLKEVLTEDYIEETVKLVKELHISEGTGILEVSKETSADVEAKLEEHLVYLSQIEESAFPWQEELRSRCGEEADALSGLSSQVAMRLAYLDKVFLFGRAKLIELHDRFKTTPKGMPLKHHFLTSKLFLYVQKFSEHLPSFLGSRYFTNEETVPLNQELFDVLYECLVQCLNILDLITDSQLAYELWWNKDKAESHEECYIKFAALREGEQPWTQPQKSKRRKENLSLFSKYVAMLVDISKNLDGYGAQLLSDLEKISKGEFVTATKAEDQIPDLLEKLAKLSLQ